MPCLVKAHRYSNGCHAKLSDRVHSIKRNATHIHHVQMQSTQTHMSGADAQHADTQLESYHLPSSYSIVRSRDWELTLLPGQRSRATSGCMAQCQQLMSSARTSATAHTISNCTTLHNLNIQVKVCLRVCCSSRSNSAACQNI